MKFILPKFSFKLRNKSVDTKIKKIDTNMKKVNNKINKLIVDNQNSIELQRGVIINAEKQILNLQTELVKINKIKQ
jgi:hypothetical protein